MDPLNLQEMTTALGAVAREDIVKLDKKERNALAGRLESVSNEIALTLAKADALLRWCTKKRKKIAELKRETTRLKKHIEEIEGGVLDKCFD
tara:strand:+ start:885 stop:1160 length:276 start_codon:yes stop_codon:yes gene_type:complete